MFMSVYVNIYKYMQVYAILSSYIRVYMGIYAYIQNFKQFEKVCITAGFEPVISCILSAGVTTALRASPRRYCHSGPASRQATGTFIT